MKQKIFFTIAILSLLCMAVFVSALTTSFDNFNGVSVKKGWNLVSMYAVEDIFDTSLGENQNYQNYLRELGVDAAFYYNDGEYIRLYPNKEINKINSIHNNEEVVYRSIWVYSSKNKFYEFDDSTMSEVSQISYDSIPLYSGWNFVNTIPFMMNKNLNELKGSCNIQKAYFWNAEEQDWAMMQLTQKFNEEGLLGRGMVIKVSSNCKLGTNGEDSSIIPPSMPIDCEEDDGGKNIYVRGTTTGMSGWGVGDESSVQVSVTDTCEEENYDNYLREYYCLDNVVQDEGNFCPNGTSCSNGACI